MITDLPIYKCHKLVRAGIILKALRGKLSVNVERGTAVIEVAVPDGWCTKHDVQAGGYYVEYQDGYQSYSPADVFEVGYTLVQEAEQLTGGACANPCSGSASADTMPAYDYVGEAKRPTLSQILIGRSFGGSTLTDIASEITKAFDALEDKPLPHASQSDYAALCELTESLQQLGDDFDCPAGLNRITWLRSQLMNLARRRDAEREDDFSHALIWLKEGNRVARKGWNGADQWIVIIDPSRGMYTEHGQSAPMQKCFGLKNAQGNMQPGWIPSMGDLMATDWYVVE